MAKTKTSPPEAAVKPAEDSMQRIVALMRARDLMQNELEEAEANVRTKRKGVEKANYMVFAAIREESQPSLFSAGVTVSDDEVAAASAIIAAEPAEPEPPSKPAVDDARRAQSIEVFNFPKGVAAALLGRTAGENKDKAPLDTVGKVLDFAGVENPNWIGIEGLTKSSVKKLEACIQDFLAK